MEHILSPLGHGFVFGLGEFCFWKSSKLVFRTVFRNILFLSAMKKFSGSGKRPLPENSLRAARGGPQACLTIPRCMIIIAKKGGSVNNSISTNRAPRAKHFDTRRRSGASIFCKGRLSLCRLSVTIGIVAPSVIHLQERRTAMRVILKEEIVNVLKALGLASGDTVMVHTSLKRIGYVCGGAQTVVEALMEAVGPDGTIMMPTQSWKNLDPETGVHWEADEQDRDLIRENWPAYDKRLTPTNTMGAVAELFRQLPGSIRSDHPARSVCAAGKYAKYLTENHDLSNIFGDGSPIGKLYALNGKVLLLGTGYDKNTSLHLADVRADYPGKHTCIEHSAVLEHGVRVWKAYETLYMDGADFEQIGADFERTHPVPAMQLGGATVKLMSQRDLVDHAVQWITDQRGR